MNMGVTAVTTAIQAWAQDDRNWYIWMQYHDAMAKSKGQNKMITAYDGLFCFHAVIH